MELIITLMCLISITVINVIQTIVLYKERKWLTKLIKANNLDEVIKSESESELERIMKNLTDEEKQIVLYHIEARRKLGYNPIPKDVRAFVDYALSKGVAK